jgi:pimeloyl-ACP methyl ester carboxylesterase
MEFTTVRNGAVALNVAVAGTGPLIVCVHGWPELWYSWRHQIDHFSQTGYRVAALDVRGYGGSSKPKEIAAYSMRSLVGDVAAVIDELGGGKAILFGHDWGAPIVWNTSLLHPEKTVAVAGLSVPYFPHGGVPTLDVVRATFAGRFFYQIYFLKDGVAEEELEADVRTSLRKIYFALSGDAELNKWIEHKPADAKLLDGMTDPDPFPSWMSEKDLAVYVEAFRSGGFRGPINRYRAQNIDYVGLREVAGKRVKQPSFFIGGERDAVRSFLPQTDLYANPGSACTDFRGAVIVPGAGHWIQQEAPQATNEALARFLAGL